MNNKKILLLADLIKIQEKLEKLQKKYEEYQFDDIIAEIYSLKEKIEKENKNV